MTLKLLFLFMVFPVGLSQEPSTIQQKTAQHELKVEVEEENTLFLQLKFQTSKGMQITERRLS